MPTLDDAKLEVDFVDPMLGPHLSLLYPYWIQKREAKGKPLISILEDPCKDLPPLPSNSRSNRKKKVLTFISLIDFVD